MSKKNSEAAITKYYRLSDLNNRNLFSHSSGDQKPKIKVPSGFVSGEASLPGLQIAAFLLCLHMVFPYCVQGERENSGVSSFSYKNTNPIRL